MDRQVVLPGGKFTITGSSCLGHSHAALRANPKTKNLLLVHYPTWADRFEGEKFDLVLAGHSHGGQVRIPGLGAVLLPFGVGNYDLGMFMSSSGPLYVNPGIGWFPFPIRFNCRPEITIFDC
jgi:predicted MPP superfamily phosphohydrolase